jgi:hypothetical protein
VFMSIRCLNSRYFFWHTFAISSFSCQNPKNASLAPKRHFVNNLRPVTEVWRALLDIIRILRPYFEPLH